MNASNATSAIRQSDSIKEISKALFAVQCEMETVSKDARNDAFKGSKYATFTAVWRELHPRLVSAGLVVMQSPGEARIENTTRANEPSKWEKEKGVQTEYINETIYIMKFTTRVTHAESGEWVESISEIPTRKIDPQGFGSSVTYARRYCLSPLIGIVVDDDDDGNAGSGQRPVNDQRPASKPPQKQPDKPPAKPKKEPHSERPSVRVQDFLFKAGCETPAEKEQIIKFIKKDESVESIKTDARALLFINEVNRAIKAKEFTVENVKRLADPLMQAVDAFKS